jgi:phage/plasmid-associated DNA primase
MTPGPQRSVLWMFGPPGGGKGTMSTITQRMHAHSEAVDLHQLDKAEQRYKCVGASLLTVSEVGEKKSWAESPFKAMVVGDAIDVRKLYGQAFTYRWDGKMVIDAQQPPYYEDKSGAVADRIVPVLFGTPKAGGARTIDLANRIIDEELHLVADWVLAGLQRIAKRGGKPMPREEWPEECRAILAGTRTNNDPLREWLTEVDVTCDETLPARPKSEVEAAWAAWTEDNGYVDAFGKPKLAGRSFWTALRKMPEMLKLITGAQDETVPDPHKPGRRTRACRIALGPEDAARLRAKAAHEAKARAEAWSKTQVIEGTEGMPF